MSDPTSKPARKFCEAAGAIALPMLDALRAADPALHARVMAGVREGMRLVTSLELDASRPASWIVLELIDHTGERLKLATLPGLAKLNA